MQNDFEISQLRHFVVVAKLQNFTKAAEELNISQPALSRSIQKLESDLGHQLFERKHRRIILTNLGQTLLTKSQAILSLVQDTSNLIQEEGRISKIRLGAIPTVAPYILPSFLKQFATNHQDIATLVQEDVTENLIKRCRLGEIDAIMTALPIPDRNLKVEFSYDEELMLCCPKGHPLDHQDTAIDAHQISAYPFITLNEAHCLSEDINQYCRQQSVNPVTVEKISQIFTVQELISLNHGISILPESVSKLDNCPLRVYKRIQNPPKRSIAIITNPYTYQNPKLEVLLDELRKFMLKPMT